MKNINLENAWCKTTQENYDALVKLGYESSNNIANAFRKEFETHLFIKNNIIKWGHKNCIGTINDPNFWGKDREIYLVDGIFQYRIQLPKPKNNFKEYGFEADFEGEILKEVDGVYLGYVIDSGHIEMLKIYKDGSAYGNRTNRKYFLTPIKKEWYKNPDNFPCVVLDRNYNMFLVKGLSVDGFLTQEFNRQVGHAEHFRPATKEEILSLLVKEHR